MKVKNIYIDLNNQLVIEFYDNSIESFDLSLIKRLNLDDLKTIPTGLEIPFDDSFDDED